MFIELRVAASSGGSHPVMTMIRIAGSRSLAFLMSESPEIPARLRSTMAIEQ